jgi:hypothetical protein
MADNTNFDFIDKANEGIQGSIDKATKPGLLGSIMDFFTRGGAKIKELMTDDKGLFQGGESDRIFGRVRDLFENKGLFQGGESDRIFGRVRDLFDNKGVPTKSEGFAGVTEHDLPEKLVRVVNQQNPNFAAFEMQPQTVEEGQNVIYGGTATGYKPLKTVNRELTPEEMERSKIARYMQENPNATRADIRELERESRNAIREAKKSERLRQRAERMQRQKPGGY